MFGQPIFSKQSPVISRRYDAKFRILPILKEKAWRYRHALFV